MWINSIKYSNFRNYKELTLEFQKRLIFFIGNNGEGKTNIIEGIHIFSTLKSFRDNSDEEIIGWGNKFYYIRSEIQTNVPKTLEIGYTVEKEKKKKIKINGVELDKKSDLIGELKTVTFSPLDLKILEGGPAERRKFIDTFLCSINKPYMEALLEYNRLLKHRNKLLKEKQVFASDLLPWDKMLTERGIFIQKQREKTILEISKYFKENLQKLSSSRDNLDLRYLPNVKNNEHYKSKLEEKRDFDIRMGYTSVGIHRDDIFIGRGDLEIMAFGSQGQKRSAVLSMKTSIYQYIKNEIGESPVLLIDDVIRELDVFRREYFINLLMECGQVFFTTTDLDGIRDFIGSMTESVQVFKVENSSVQEVLL